MRIGIDCRSLQKPQPSGVSLYALEMLRELVQLPESAEYEFVLFFNGHQLRGNSELAQHVRQIREELTALREEIGGVALEWRVKYFPSKLFKVFQIFLKRPAVKWMFGSVDVVYVPNVDYYPLNDSSVPYVATMHDLSFERHPDCFTPKTRWWHRLLRPREFALGAVQILAVSQHTKTELEQIYGVDPGKCRVVYPGVPRVADIAQSIEEQVEADEKRFQIPERYILCLATVEPRKNIDALLEAFKAIRTAHPDLQLVVAGGAGWQSHQTIEQMNQQDGVHYVGYVTDREKAELLHNAELFVYPSIYEGFGLPPLEAQRAGVPVIVGSHSSLPEVLGQSAVYADVLDVHSLECAMMELLEDAGLREEMVTTGKQNIQRFSWNKAASELFEILKGLG